MKGLVSLVLVAALLSGCSLINPYGTWGEEGAIWCNDRYRKNTNWEEPEARAALSGYMYVLAAALTLQNDEPQDKEAYAHRFERPERLSLLDAPRRFKSGFEATTFLLEPLVPGEREELIISFAGSNDRQDWYSTNLNPFGRRQYDQAVEYSKKIVRKYGGGDRKVVISGISLGGGLAIHVLKQSGLEPQIDEVWAINPSPKIYSDVRANSRMKSKTWLVFSKGEVLDLIRGWGGDKIEPGVGQLAEFGLIESNSIYAHYRWGIARQVLWVADYELTRSDKQAWTEPLAILKDSDFRSCKKTEPDPALQPAGPKPDYSAGTCSRVGEAIVCEGRSS